MPRPSSRLMRPHSSTTITVLILLFFLVPSVLFDCRTAEAAPRARISDRSGTTTVAMRLIGSHLYVEGKVNGKPARFVLDSGAGANILTPEAAERFGVPLKPQKVRAQGAGTVEAGLATVGKIDIGQASLEEETVLVLSLPPQLEVDGLLGYGFFSRFAVTLDYEQGSLTLTSPEKFRAAPEAAVLPLKITGNIPFVEAEADGLKGLFQLDTGAAGSLILFAPFVEKHGLRTRYSPRIETITGRGIGGLLRGELVRIPSLRLGNIVVRSLIADLSLQTSGSFHDKTAAGNIGAEILQRFTVTTDYHARKLYLTPNRRFNDPFPQNRSGLAIDLNDFTYTVAAVVADSPGAEAGIKAGDTLLAIGGVRVDKLKSDGIREEFRRPAGTVLPLIVRSGANEKPRTITVTLRDLL
ncbi:MAG: aspartyl protease family protein [Armatimonadota bacterium]